MGPGSRTEPRAARRCLREERPSHRMEEYRERYLAEIGARRARIEELAARVGAGETITLLCSNSCVDDETCHRSLLRELIETAVGR